MARMTSKATSRTGRSDSARSLRSNSPDVRQRMIGEAAYYRYVQRGFGPGHELDDWLAAEADFERASLGQHPPEADTIEDFGVQHGGTHGPAEDEMLKRAIRAHPRRDIPRIESVEPEDAPRKE